MASRLPWPASSLPSATNSSILTARQKRWLSTAVTVMAVADAAAATNNAVHEATYSAFPPSIET
eukprot:scaffold748_cov35-Cyclotella_meneghiniana.AAC.2